MKKLLAIETSCDETSVALLTGDSGEVKVEALQVSSQIDKHRPFGGVVPELATRQHLLHLDPMVRSTLSEVGWSLNDLDAVAATRGPGLNSSLLIGFSFANAIAVSADTVFYGINHLEGHLYSPFIEQGQLPEFPQVALIVSGGHTQLIHAESAGSYRRLGTTLDDAAGEAFDKIAKMLGLPYPGGPEVDKRAALGNVKAWDFPRSMLHSGDFNFSFSGLKTSARTALQKAPEVLKDEGKLNDFCASFQEAIVEVLVKKGMKAAHECGHTLLTVSGGVSCNKRLREAFAEASAKEGVRCLFSSPKFSTDNAAMIGAVAIDRLMGGAPSDLDVDVDPNLKLA